MSKRAAENRAVHAAVRLRRRDSSEPAMSSGSLAEASAMPESDTGPKKKTVKPLTKKKLEKHLAAAENRGALKLP